MKIKSFKIRNFRTISTERMIELNEDLTIVGPNNSGKTNILKAVQMFFTGYENKFNYDKSTDFSFGVSRDNKTSINIAFIFNEEEDDLKILEQHRDIIALLGLDNINEKEIQLYLYFNDNKPTYRFFPNIKRPKEKQAKYSAKERQLVSEIIDKFIIHYIPSDKSFKELYDDLITPFLRVQIAKVLDPYKQEINNVLKDASQNLTSQLEDAGISNIKAKFSLPNESLESIINKFDLILDDNNETSIFRKGLGIQSAALLSSFLWVTQQEKNEGKTVIWLIEEPESYLHPKLAEAHREILNRLMDEAIVMCTTHSMRFVPQDPSKVLGTKLINKSTSIEKFKTYSEATKMIRENLGVKFGDFYNLGLYNIFVEGQTDRDYIKYILKNIPTNIDGNDLSWDFLRSNETVFLDFGGVKFMSSFMFATYEFISKESACIAIFDGDDAGEKERRVLQSYFGKKKIGFTPNHDYLSIRKGFAIEGLFPDRWVADIYEERPNWFEDYSIDAFNTIQSFKVADTHKNDFLKRITMMIDTAPDLKWAERWIKVFELLNASLEKQSQKIYG